MPNTQVETTSRMSRTTTEEVLYSFESSSENEGLENNPHSGAWSTGGGDAPAGETAETEDRGAEAHPTAAVLNPPPARRGSLTLAAGVDQDQQRGATHTRSRVRTTTPTRKAARTIARPRRTMQTFSLRSRASHSYHAWTYVCQHLLVQATAIPKQERNLQRRQPCLSRPVTLSSMVRSAKQQLQPRQAR